MSDVCHWTRFRGERVHIPGCMGAAVYGLGGCTCDLRKHRKRLEERVEVLETLVREMLCERSPLASAARAALAASPRSGQQDGGGA